MNLMEERELTRFQGLRPALNPFEENRVILKIKRNIVLPESTKGLISWRKINK